MKNYFFIFIFLTFSKISAQVGIGTTDPKVTLEIKGKPSDTTVFDGLITPQITGNQLNSKDYSFSHHGTILFVTEPLSNTNLGQCENLIKKGYFYFDHNGTSGKWIAFESKNKVSNELFFEQNDYYFVSMIIENNRYKVLRYNKNDVNEEKIASGTGSQPNTISVIQSLTFN